MTYNLPSAIFLSSSFQPLLFSYLSLALLPISPPVCPFCTSHLHLPAFVLMFNCIHCCPFVPLYPIPLLFPCLVHRENKGTNSIGSRLGSLSYLDNDEDVFDDKPIISPRTRTLPPKSYTIDTPYYFSEPSEPFLKEDKPRTASPASGRATSPPTSRVVDIVDSPAGSDTTPTITPSSHSSQSPAAAPLQRRPVLKQSSTAKTEETTTIVSSSSSIQKVPEPTRSLLGTLSEVEAPSSRSLYKHQPQLSSVEPKRAAAPLQRSAVLEHTSTAKKEETTTIVSPSSSPQKVPEPSRPLSGAQTEVEAPSFGSLYKQQPQLNSMEPKPPGLSRVSASLPRSYRRSDSARLTSVVAPRPFGSQPSRITSLPRASTVSTRYFIS